jgi:hypothetical protein
MYYMTGTEPRTEETMVIKRYDTHHVLLGKAAENKKTTLKNQLGNAMKKTNRYRGREYQGRGRISR